MSNLFNTTVFESLSFKIQREICQTLVEKELKRLAEVGYANLECDDSAINALFLGGYSEKYGARNMRDFVQNQIGNAIVEVLLANKTPCGKLTFSKEKGKIQFAETSKPKGANKKSDSEFLEWFLALSKSRKV